MSCVPSVLPSSRRSARLFSSELYHINRGSSADGTLAHGQRTYNYDLECQPRLFKVLDQEPHDDANVVVLLIGQQQDRIEICGTIRPAPTLKFLQTMVRPTPLGLQPEETDDKAGVPAISEESGVISGLDEMLVEQCNHTNMGGERKRERHRNMNRNRTDMALRGTIAS